MRDFKRRATAVGLAVVLSAFTWGSPATAAEISTPAPAVSSSTDIGILSAWQYNTYVDNFKSQATCNSRGYAMVHYDPDFVGKVINWSCHKRSGDSKWSMDTLWKT